jgi:formylglycine-generating enzyme required for sulfatase activity
MKRHRIMLGALVTGLLAMVASGCGKAAPPVPMGLTVPIPLVEIPPGRFLMGSPASEAEREANETQHLVKITYPFKMGKTEVTQRQWREVMGTTIQQQRDQAQKAHPPGTVIYTTQTLIQIWVESVKKFVFGEDRWPLHGVEDDCPMYYVSWDRAVEFCQQLTDLERAGGDLALGTEYRLPTEAEWEYACRAGSTTRFANGDTEADLGEIAWYNGNSGGITHPVGIKLPNAWGLHDMHGNVREWCLDWYDDYPLEAVTNPCGSSRGFFRVFRGGCRYSSANSCRAAIRDDYPPLPQYLVGFRVVLAPILPRN